MAGHYPAEYELPLTEGRGIQLAGQRLKPGWEVVVARQNVRCDGMDFPAELVVVNLGGSYLIRCCNVTKDQWLQTFLFCPDKKVFAR